MPPLDGPRAMLWVTRKPWKTPVDPSSIETGIETSIAFLHPERTRIRFGSSAKISPTRRSWVFASSNGFSLRWDSASAVDMELRLLACLDGGEYRARKRMETRRLGTLRGARQGRRECPYRRRYGCD